MNEYVKRQYSVAKVVYRGAAATKNITQAVFCNPPLVTFCPK